MIIQAHSAVIDGEVRENVWIETANQHIVSINDGAAESFDYLVTGMLIPGFVDMHCHGGGGKYFSADTDAEIEIAIATHRFHGTTSLCASLVTEPLDTLVSQIGRLVPFAERSELIGIHLEGPYLAESRCGAHDPALLRTPNIAEFDRLLDAGKGHVKMVTIAPELDGAIAAIKHLVAAGVVVAIGHSAANFEEAKRGVDAGATIVTHFPNAVSKLDEEGQTFATMAMSDNRIALELILDGHHVEKAIVDRIYSVAQHRLALVTDAMCAAGSSDGKYLIGNLPVTVKDSVARLDTNGALAGSTLTMDQAFMNMITLQGLAVSQAVFATSTLPAKLFGLTDRGEIAVGKRADLLDVDLLAGKVRLVN
jgi:N-acetylglucosamine-6-phosphate deacetylase